MRAGFALAALVAAFGSPASAEELPPKTIGRVVDMVVARVDQTVITLSELVAETRLVLLRTHGPDGARRATLSRDLLRAVLRAMVSRELLLSEARRLQLRPVPEVEVDAAARDILARFSSTGDYIRFLERVGFTIPEEDREGLSIPVPPVLESILRSERQVERFIALRIRPSATVRRDDVERCYERNRLRLGGEPLEKVRALLEQTIRDERAEATLADLLAQLERRALIRYAPDFRPDERPGIDSDDEGGIVCNPR